jgi:hypothetical protein
VKTAKLSLTKTYSRFTAISTPKISALPDTNRNVNGVSGVSGTSQRISISARNVHTVVSVPEGLAPVTVPFAVAISQLVTFDISFNERILTWN